LWRKFGNLTIALKFALPKPHTHTEGRFAGVAQLVEHDLAKVGVASSSLVSRSDYLVIWRLDDLENYAEIVVQIIQCFWGCDFIRISFY
jgi:hypothetical protein